MNQDNLILISSPLVRDHSESVKDFGQRIIQQIKKWNVFDLAVLPEYCWRDADYEDILNDLEEIKKNIPSSSQIVLGSIVKKMKSGDFTNNALYINGNGDIHFIPKVFPLKEERERHNVVSGRNTDIINFRGIKVATVICGDLWHSKLLEILLTDREADILLVPAFTAVPKDHEGYARTQWYSLTIARSREYVIPIIVADHSEGGKNYDVGAVSCIADPSKKNKTLKSYNDFLEIPNNEWVKYKIDLNKISKYRDYRLKKGLLVG